MKIVTFKCENCGNEYKVEYKTEEKIPFYICCKCTKKAKRYYNEIVIEKELENVSAAAQTMLYSSLPSGKNKVNI